MSLKLVCVEHHVPPAQPCKIEDTPALLGAHEVYLLETCRVPMRQSDVHDPLLSNAAGVRAFSRPQRTANLCRGAAMLKSLDTVLLREAASCSLRKKPARPARFLSLFMHAPNCLTKNGFATTFDTGGEPFQACIQPRMFLSRVKRLIPKLSEAACDLDPL
jgi:hypothetical protein